MAKTTFASLGLKVQEGSAQVIIGEGKLFTVKKYLPMEDKIDLINITLQKALKNGVYEDALLEMYFNLNVIYMYADLSFTEKQRENEPKLYDLLESNGVINAVLDAIGDDWQYLHDMLIETRKSREQFIQSVGGVVSTLVNLMPINAQAANDIIDNFDPKKYQNVIDFATAANGGRPIPGVTFTGAMNPPEA